MAPSLSEVPPKYWSETRQELLSALDSSPEGLSSPAARERLEIFGPNLAAASKVAGPLRMFLDKFRNPLVLILLFASAVAIFTHDWLESFIVLAIILGSTVLSFVSEYRASEAVKKLRQRVRIKAQVLRDGNVVSCPAEEIVPGDIVQVSAGSLIPADGVLLESRDLFVSQALLTGETFPSEKAPGEVPEDSTTAERSNCLFMGTSVRSGTGTFLVIRTGSQTTLGEIAAPLAATPPETEFERGLRRFGSLLLHVMVIIVFAIFFANVMLKRPLIETMLFAVALAVGLSPEMLPVILSVTLSRGAQNMAAHGVIVKRLNAIENLGSMNVLCSDKTGTLTEGVMKIEGALDAEGNPSEEVFQWAFLNSSFQSGLSNPLDEAFLADPKSRGLTAEGYRKLDEIPYDFVRKRLSVLVASPEGKNFLVTKGAMQNVLEMCTRVDRAGAIDDMDDGTRGEIMDRFASWSMEGYRVIGIARKAVDDDQKEQDEKDLEFLGYLRFSDPPAEGVAEELDELRSLGVRLKMITGDNRYVARHVGGAVGVKTNRVITGSELSGMRDEALWHLVGHVDIFAEVDPNQKERIIRAFQTMGSVVGFLGDGINDAPALNAADVGISVDKAVDVAKEAADFVLMEHSLDMVRQGIQIGRRTFANTIKYIFITTSANFGNMISMAAGSLFLPFLPLLAKQVLLNNFMTDIPSVGIAGDRVDPEWEREPHRWNIKIIRNFMITFGLVSTAFDLLTFYVLLRLAGSVASIFRTGWFIESLLTELLVLFVVRTYGPFYKSRPGTFILISSALLGFIAVALPFLPVGRAFGFVPLPWPVLSALLSITLLYLVVSESTKRAFFRFLKL